MLRSKRRDINVEEVVKTRRGEEIRRRAHVPSSSDKPISNPCLGFALGKGGKTMVEPQDGEVGTQEALTGDPMMPWLCEDLGTGRCGLKESCWGGGGRSRPACQLGEGQA